MQERIGKALKMEGQKAENPDCYATAKESEKNLEGRPGKQLLRRVHLTRVQAYELALGLTTSKRVVLRGWDLFLWEVLQKLHRHGEAISTMMLAARCAVLMMSFRASSVNALCSSLHCGRSRGSSQN